MSIEYTPVLTADYLLNSKVALYAWQNAEEEPVYNGMRMDWLCIDDTTALFPELEGVETVRAAVTMNPPAGQEHVYCKFENGQLYIDQDGWSYQATHDRLRQWLAKACRSLDSSQFYAWVEEVK